MTYMNFGTAVRKWAEAQNKTLAQCKVAYHTIVEEAGTPWTFKLKCDLDVVARMKNEQVPANQVNAGTVIGVKQIASLDKLTCVAWSCKWTASGLMPVRPLLVTKENFSLKAGVAVEL